MALSPFEQAYADARKAGKSTFTFEGKSYSSELKSPTTTGPSTRGTGSTNPSRTAARSEPSTRGGASRASSSDDDTPSTKSSRSSMSSEASRYSNARSKADAAQKDWYDNDDPKQSDAVWDKMNSTIDDKFKEGEAAGYYSKGGLVKNARHHATKVLPHSHIHGKRK